MRISKLWALCLMPFLTTCASAQTVSEISPSQRVKDNQHQWPAVYLEYVVESRADIIQPDPTGSWQVLIDGNAMTMPPAVKEKIDETSFSISHVSLPIPDFGRPVTVRLEKINETQYAVGATPKVIGPKVKMAPPKAHKIAFYGASGEVGYGNMSPKSECTPEERHVLTNSSLAWPALLSKRLEADYQVNAFSGLGMVRNFGGFEHAAFHMPLLADRVLFDDPSPYDHSQFVPDLIMIDVGGNDFSTPLTANETWKTPEALEDDFVNAYVAFVKSRRALAPKAHIIIMGGGLSPFGRAMERVDAVLKAEGFTNYSRLIMPPLARTGCHNHPNLEDHRLEAETAYGHIKNLGLFH